MYRQDPRPPSPQRVRAQGKITTQHNGVRKRKISQTEFIVSNDEK